MSDLQLLDGRISKERHLVFVGKDDNRNPLLSIEAYSIARIT